MNITNSFVAGTVHLGIPDLSACFQTTVQAIWQRCQLALHVSSWLLGARARRLLAQSRELIALIISKPYMYVRTFQQTFPQDWGGTRLSKKKGKTMKFLKWHGCFCVPVRVGVTLLPWYAVPKSCRKGFQHQIIGESECGGPLPRILSWTQGSSICIIVTSDIMNNMNSYYSACMCLLLSASREMVGLQTSFVLHDFLKLSPLIAIQSPSGICGESWWYIFCMSFPGLSLVFTLWFVSHAGTMLPRSRHKPLARGGQVQIWCRDGRESEERTYEDLRAFK